MIALIYTNEEMCPSDLEVILEFTQSKTSRQLAILKQAGLVTTRKIDRWVLFSVPDEIGDIVGNLLNLFERDALLAQDQEHFRIMYSNRELVLNKLQNRHYTGIVKG